MLVFANNASAALSTDQLAGDTTLAVTSGYGTAFPTCAVADGTSFFATLTNVALPGTREIVLVTEHTAFADTMTVVRGQEGTTALDWAAGSTLECRVTAATLAQFESKWIATVGDSLSGFNVVAVGSDGRLRRADCTAAPHMGTVVGVVIAYAAEGDSATVQTGKVIENAGWTWTPGPVLLGTAGALTQTLDSNALFIQVVGYSLGPAAMIVDVQAPVLRSGMASSIVPLSIDLPAVGAIAAGDWINIFDNASVFSVRKADATATGYEAHGFVLVAVADTETATVYLMGTNTGVSVQTPGTVYLQTMPGLGGATKPVTTGNVVQRLGVAISATAVAFAPGDLTVV